MDTQSENAIRVSLEATRDALTSSKFAIESLLERVNRNECDVAINKAAIDEIKLNAIRTEERLSVMQKTTESMAGDTRSIRNSVVAALLVSFIIGVSGLAVSSFHQPSTNRSHPVAK